MNRPIKIQDIAEIAGVSAGTVDRVLHNRGRVSQTSRIAVENAIAQTGYKFNIHTSAVALKKGFNILVVIPTSKKGEYWDFIQKGINKAIAEYSDISLNCNFLQYDQFDFYNCRDLFQNIPEVDTDAVIIGATFVSETENLCRRLDDKGIPYVFVDSYIENTNPQSAYSCNQEGCGRLIARILSILSGKGADYVILSSERTGRGRSINSLQRIAGFKNYFHEKQPESEIHESWFSMTDPVESECMVLDFFHHHPEVRNIAVMNSRGYVIADILKRNGMDDVNIVCLDLTDDNMRCLREGTISALVCQRPEAQGYHSMEAIIRTLLYKKKEDEVKHIMPLDIIFAENLPYYQEIYID